MSIHRFLWVVVVLFVGLGFGQEDTFVLKTALMGPKDQGRVEAVALSPDKQTLVFASSYGYKSSIIYILDAKTGQTLWSTSGCGGIFELQFIDKQKVFIRGFPLADGGGDLGCILNIDPAIPLQRQFFEGQEVTPYAVEFCPENNPSDPYPYIGSCEAFSNNGTLSPDQSLIARVIDNTVIDLHDATTSRVLHTLNSDLKIWGAKFSLDSQLLAVVHEGSSLSLWRTQTGLRVSKIEAKLPLESEDRVSVNINSFSPDSRFLLLEYNYSKPSNEARQKTYKSIRVLWDIENQREQSVLEEGGTYTFNENGKLLFRIAKNQLEVWNTATMQKLQTFTSPYDFPQKLFTAFDNTLLFAYYHRFWEDSGDTLLWDLQTGEEKLHLRGTTALSVRDDVFITGNSQGEPNIWDTATCKELRTFSGHYTSAATINFSDSSKLITGAAGPTISVWELATGQRFEKTLDSIRDDEVTFGLAFNKKEDSLIVSRGVSGFDEGFRTSIRLWNFELEELSTLIPAPTGKTFYGYMPDGSYVAIDEWITDPEIFIANTPIVARDNATISPNGKYTAVGNLDGTAELFDAVGGTLIHTFSGHAAGRYGHSDERVKIAFSPENRVLVTAGYTDGKIQIWEIETGSLIKTLWADEGTIRNIEFSPDGQFLITEYDNKKLWSIEKEVLVDLPVPDDEIDWWTQHIFSPNDSLIATTGKNSIWLWNSTTGEVLAQLPGGTPTFSPDGRLLVVNTAYPGLDNAVSIYGAEDNSPIFLKDDISYKDILAKDENELVTNGSFSVGQAGWLLDGDVWAGNKLGNFKSSPGYAALGVSKDGDRMNKAIGKLSQVLIIPETATSSTLSFWYTITTEETTTIVKDQLHCQLESDTVLASFDFSNLDATKAYKEVRPEAIDLSSKTGQRLYLNCYGETDEAYPTVFRLDDVSLQIR
jgi:WD40 repeat protein